MMVGADSGLEGVVIMGIDKGKRFGVCFTKNNGKHK